MYQVRYQCWVLIDDDLFYGYAAVFDLSAPFLHPDWEMKTGEGMPHSGAVDLTGRGPFRAIADDKGYCRVEWTDGSGFLGGCPRGEGAADDRFDSPFFKVTEQVTRALKSDGTHCRTRYIIR